VHFIAILGKAALFGFHKGRFFAFQGPVQKTSICPPPKLGAMEAAALHRGPPGESPENGDFTEARHRLTPDGDDDFTAAFMGLVADGRGEKEKEDQSTSSTSPSMTPISLRILKGIDWCVIAPKLGPTPSQHSTAKDSNPGWATTKRQVGAHQSVYCDALCPACTYSVRSSCESREDGASGARMALSVSASASSAQDPPADDIQRREVASYPGQLASTLPAVSDDAWQSLSDLQQSLNSSRRTSSISTVGGGSRPQAHITPTRHVDQILRASLQDPQYAESAEGSVVPQFNRSNDD